ncbi:MAG: TonB-dependent receptor [Bacteroidales bacterium]|nr:TonB-dependent receptor [Bacteroidales bacterium]
MNQKIRFFNKWMVLFVLFCGFIFSSPLLASADSNSSDLNTTSGKALQQEIEITGQVTDAETGEPLPGVNIVVEGTSIGTTTDMDGNYTLEAPSDGTLIFSFVGYQQQSIDVSGQQEINVELQQAVTELEEVVAVGYATQQAGEVTGSVSSVDTDELADMASVNASESLKGSVSGVTVQESHTPGGGASIRIRGLGTINDNNPLWVVDGVPGGNVNPENIESISILKDAAAQAIYGARAANGVVLVTTKSGQKGQPTQVNVKVRNGISRNKNSYNLLNTREYGEMLWLMADNSGREDYSHVQYGSGDEPTIPEYILPAGADEADHSNYDRKMVHEDGDDTYIIMKANQEGTDWMDVIDRDAAYQEYSVDLSGGSETTNYSFQVGYTEEEGVLKHTGFERYNLRSNVTTNPADWLEVGEKIGVTYSKDWGNQGDNAEWTAISQTYRMQPIVPVYDIKGNLAGTRAEGTGNANNPYFDMWSNRHDWNKSLNASGNAYAEATIFEGLSLRTLFGFDYDASQGRNIGYVEKAFSERGKFDGLSESDWFGLQWNWSNTLEYSNTFAEIHDLTVMAGTEAIDNNSRWRGASRDQFFSRNPIYMQMDAGVQNQTNYGNVSEWALFSVFGRVNYTLSDKYLLEGVIRRDGSSRFGSENRYGLFPAFSAGWRISNESFMAGTDNWLDFLKLRVGYGETGNDRIGNYNSFTTFASSSWSSYYPVTGANSGPGSSGFYRSSFGNPNVLWESTVTSNLGLDATLFENIDITVDLWQRVTEDMLYPKRIPDVLGQASAPSINVGEMENTGIDVELGYQGAAMNNELQYNINLNVSSYKNEVVRLSGQEEEFMQGSEFREMSYTRAESGTQFPEFYGYVVEGIFQSESEANNHPTAFGEDGDYNEAGRFKYKDVNEDGIINEEDRTYIGDPHPDFTAGLNFSLTYKGFRLSTRLYTSYGNDMVNYVRRWIDFEQFLGNRSHRRLYESWGSPYLDNNENAAMPKAEFDDIGSQYPNTYFMEDASYLRMQNLRISYDLSTLFPGEAFRNIVIYGQATNLFTITNYSGLDPEVNTSGINKGIDRGAWPTSQRIMFGVNLGL